MNNSNPLVSVIVLCYNKFCTLYETLNSIFSQDYPVIELLVADDGSADFDLHRQKILDYIIKNRSINIVDFQIIHNEYNVGTVKNANGAIKESTGEYIKFLSPDDYFNNQTALSRLINAAQKQGSLILAAQAECYEVNSTVIENRYPTNREISLMKVLNSTEQYLCLLKQIVHINVVTVIFKREVFLRFGYFLEDYVLIEDYPYWYHLTSKGVHIDQLCEPVVIYGIGDGVSTTLSKSDTYYNDLKRLITESVEECPVKINKRFYVYIQERAYVFNRAQKRIKHSPLKKKMLPLLYPDYVLYFFYKKFHRWRLEARIRNSKHQGG